MHHMSRRMAPKVIPGPAGSGTETVRFSVTFERDKAEAITRIAEEKKVSTAWVIRDAVDRYLANGKNAKR